jgi:hypothetical protein
VDRKFHLSSSSFSFSTPKKQLRYTKQIQHLATTLDITNKENISLDIRKWLNGYIVFVLMGLITFLFLSCPLHSSPFCADYRDPISLFDWLHVVVWYLRVCNIHENHSLFITFEVLPWRRNFLFIKFYWVVRVIIDQ